MEIRQFRQIANAPARFKVIDWVPQHLDGAICRCYQSGEYFNDGTFTSAVRSQEAKGLAALHHKTNIVHGYKMAICLAQVFNLHSRTTTLFNVVVLP